MFTAARAVDLASGTPPVCQAVVALGRLTLVLVLVGVLLAPAVVHGAAGDNSLTRGALMPAHGGAQSTEPRLGER